MRPRAHCGNPLPKTCPNSHTLQLSPSRELLRNVKETAKRHRVCSTRQCLVEGKSRISLSTARLVFLGSALLVSLYSNEDSRLLAYCLRNPDVEAICFDSVR